MASTNFTLGNLSAYLTMKKRRDNITWIYRPGGSVAYIENGVTHETTHKEFDKIFELPSPKKSKYPHLDGRQKAIHG